MRMANRVKGKVKKIYAHEDLVYVSLEGLDLGVTPKEEFFLLARNHPNYNALYSLALVAAVNRYELEIRTKAEITNQEYGEDV